MTVDARDERAHDPGAGAWWWEAWHLDVAGEDGTGLSVRLACAPELGVAWWWTHLFTPDIAGAMVVRDHEVGLPRQGLEVRADGLWGELWCESPLEHWTYGLEAFGVRLDDPADSLHGEIGERMPIGLDIEWEVDADAAEPYEYRAGETVNGYEQFGTVHGEVLLGRSRFELDARARRSHTWGTPRLDRPSSSSWFHRPDQSASYSTADEHVDGFLAGRGERTEPVTSVRTETRRRADGLPLAARQVVNDRFEVDVEVLGLVTVPLAGPARERAVLSRALCRYEISGARDDPSDRRTGIGWSSWLDPTPD